MDSESGARADRADGVGGAAESGGGAASAYGYAGGGDDEPQDAIPEGWADRSASSGQGTEPGPEDAPPRSDPDEEEDEEDERRPGHRRAVLVVVAVVAASVCLATWALLPGGAAEDRAAPSGGGSPSASPSVWKMPRPDLTTPDRVRGLIADVKRRTGSTKAVSFSASDGFAWVTVPVAGDSEHFENLTYQSGRGWSSFVGSGGSDAADSVPMDLAGVDWDMLGELYRKVDGQLRFPSTSPRRELRVKAGLVGWRGHPDTPPRLSVELDDHTQIGWVEARIDGTITEVHEPVRYAFPTAPGAGSTAGARG